MRTHRFRFLLFLVGLAPVNLMGQNLVPNSSFEEYASCPGSFSRRKSEFKIKHWYAANEGTPDGFNACGRGEGGVPYNWAGVSEAYDGKGYAGIYLWLNQRDFREYIQCKLITALVKDTVYVVSFRYRLSSYSKYAVNRIGLHLSDSAILTKNDRAWNIIPTLSVVSDSALHRRTGLWEYATTEYKAVGGEQFLTLGNFFNNADTREYEIRHRPAQEIMVKDAAYYYLDDVYVRMKFDPAHPPALLATFSEKEVKLNERYVLDNILFDFNSYKLLPKSFDQLDEVVRVLKKHADFRVQISGFTDDVGGEAFNTRLSLKRAETVALYLKQQGIALNRMESQGFGKKFPLVEGNSEEERRINRRVELKFFR